MTTKLYHRLRELDNQVHFLKNGTRANVYSAIAEKAGCRAKDVADLAYDGPSGMDHFKVHRIIAATGIIQKRAILDAEMLTLLQNDTTTIESDNALVGFKRPRRW